MGAKPLKLISFRGYLMLREKADHDAKDPTAVRCCVAAINDLELTECIRAIHGESDATHGVAKIHAEL